MAQLTSNLDLIGTAAQVGGTILSGRRADAAGRYNQKVLNRQAMAERASASRAAAEEHRNKRLLQSRARAVAAASGGGAVPELIADIEREGAYRALTALYEGQTRASGLEMQGDIARMEGRQRRSMSNWSAFGTILNAAPSLYDKYGEDFEAFMEDQRKPDEDEPLRPMPRPW